MENAVKVVAGAVVVLALTVAQNVSAEKGMMAQGSMMMDEKTAVGDEAVAVVEEAVVAADEAVADQAVAQAEQAVDAVDNLAVEGYCPVCLYHGMLTKGKSKFSAIYNERTYYLDNQEQLDEFNKNQEKYGSVAAAKLKALMGEEVPEAAVDAMEHMDHMKDMGK